MLTSVFPIAMYRVLGDAEVVSEVYLLIGAISLVAALFVPYLTRFVPRRRLYTTAVILMIAGNLTASTGGSWQVPAGLAVNTVAVVVITVCFNAYVMDYVQRASLGRCETLRLFYSGAAWTIGPFLGVWLMQFWAPAPFFVSICACITLLIVFWVLRLGDGKVITRARGPAANPLGYLPRFFAQPRLIAGWTFAVVRSCGWWVYVVYLPIYAVENGFSEKLGGLALSLTNAILFLTPLMLRGMQRLGVRATVTLGFAVTGLAFTATAAVLAVPSVVIALLFFGSVSLILLDVSGGLPFLMAVKPSERTEMSAVYSTFRDVSGIMTPAVAWLVLSVAPLVMVFTASGVSLLACSALALKLHPRLGQHRLAVP
jgi:MFS family permease